MSFAFSVPQTALADDSSSAPADASRAAPLVPPESVDAESRAHALMRQDPPDWTGARAAFEEAAEAGSPSAMSYLGWIYETGQGIPKSGEQAAHWYARAARAGAHQYAVKLGWMYLGGDGVRADRAQAETWFNSAITADYAPARIAWASVLIADAQGGRDPERVEEARTLLEDALADGQSLAAYFLARLYIEGIGGHPVDPDRAAHYTRIGAENGDARLQGWLASMYYQGRGVPEDRMTAAMWASLAAAEGDPFGEQIYLVLEASLSPEEIAEARRRADTWALTQH
ncbi:hypothetical protein CKO25_19385 [Thiocapsa imhoffii]|uniref:Sel1 repeat family protein n=2 Tax=Thiocapsa imhoffii TaxID=382777 RepID=A0A9X1BBN0_9GAMM|nr:hypothetical protein [Thiocapsa imhoffii]